MAGVSEIAAVMMIGAERRIDVTAANIGNMNTPGYESRRAFSRIVDIRNPLLSTVDVPVARHSRPPAMKITGNPLDLASGAGVVFAFRAADGALISGRSAQLQRDADGRLVDRSLGALQAAGGGDIFVDAGALSVLQDGTILVDGKPEGKVGLFHRDASGQSLGDAEGVVHQGMVVASDVDLGAEMIEMTQASRMAETGAKVFQVQDDLVGRLLTRLGEFKV